MTKIIGENNYKPRVVDSIIERYLSTFGAVCIEGPKWCGKTWCASYHSNSEYLIGDPENNFQNTMFDESKVNAINLMDADQGIIPKEFYVIETVEGLYIRMDEGHYPACLTPYFTVAVKFQTEAEADEFCQTLLFEGMRWRPHTRCVKGGVLQ